mgnify:CR=1 FL=1
MHKIVSGHLRHIFVVAILLLLNACSTIKKDGPPPFDVDVSKIPDAVPKVEPRSKYDIASYRVMGRRYNVMTSSKNYEEQGIASWYGTKFHAHRTSSGERYNMLAMTAAHKTLPLPTYVQVTNLHNGKKIIVKVNDRGPFESNRLIDLSYVAAKKLGMIGHGTTYVDVKAIDPTHYDKNNFNKPARMDDLYLAENTAQTRSHRRETTHTLHYAKNTEHHAPTSGVYLQVGAFKNKAFAENMKSRVGRMISSPVMITPHTHSKLYHVEIGPIKDVATAKNITKRLKAAGVNTKQTIMEA